MSDPIPYENPTYTPFIGPYKWEPEDTPLGNSTAYGYAFQQINPGRFRQDIPLGATDRNGQTYADINTYTVEIKSYGTVKTGDIKNPVLNAFRSISRPSLNLKTDASSYVELVPVLDAQSKTNDMYYDIFMRRIGIPISAIKITYTLSYDISASDSKAAISHFPVSEDRNYPLLQVLGYTDLEGDGTEYPKSATPTAIPTELQTTFDRKTGRITTRTVTIKFGTGSVVANYPRLKKIRIKNRYSIKSLNFTISKIMIYNAEAVNLNENQLPCKALQYAYYVNFAYRPTSTGGSIFPASLKSNSDPNFFVKFFSPDDQSGTVGFAHALNLRFQIFSSPLYGLSPLGTTLGGLLTDMAYPSTFYTTFIGPTLAIRSVAYSFSHQVLKPMGMAVKLDTFPIDKSVTTIQLYKVVNYIGSSQPVWKDDASWSAIASYSVNNPEIGGKFPKEYVYLDLEGKSTDWYLMIHTNNNGTYKIYTPSFRSMPYTDDGYVFALAPRTDSITSDMPATVLRSIIHNVAPLTVDPIMVFRQNTDSFYGSLTARKGAWISRINARTTDATGLISTHLFTRFWFVPTDKPIDPTKYHEYRASTEFYFKYDDAAKSNKMVVGSPTTVDDLMMSASISNDFNTIEMRRYMDAETSLIPFQDGSYDLVVGLYAVSYVPKDTTVPSAQIEISFDSQLETTLTQMAGGMFMPQKTNVYETSSYDDGVKAFLSLNRVGSGVLSPEIGETYAKYTGHYIVSTPPTANAKAFNNLLVLSEYTEDSKITDAKIYIPYDNISLDENSYTTYVFADFTTNSKSFVDAQIKGGENNKWRIALTLNGNGTQNSYINEKVRLQGFFATDTGQVVSRVFDSGFVDKTTGTNEIVFQPTIDISFLAGQGSDLQFVLRLYSYPSYKDPNNPTNIADIEKEMGSIPFGLRVDRLAMTNTSLHRLNVVQIDTAVGSPAYYENLPIYPSKNFAGSDFAFIADPNIIGKTFITFADMDFWIQGALYSPIWYNQFPVGMEVRLGAASFEEDQLKFRTIPYSTDRKDVLSVAAAQDKVSGSVTVINDDVPTADSPSTYPAQVVRKRTLQTPISLLTSNEIIKDQKGNVFPGFNSNLAYLNMSNNQNYGRSTVLGFVAENTGKQYNDINMIMDSNFGFDSHITDPITSQLGSDTMFLKNITKNMSYPAILQPKYGAYMLVAGWRSPGILIGKYLTLWNLSMKDADSDGVYYIIDAAVDATIPKDYILPYDKKLNGAVREGHHSLICSKSGKILCAYMLDGKDDIIYGRAGNTNSKFGTTMELLSFPKITGENSTDLLVIAPVLAYNEILDIAYLAFYCAGKVFVTYLSGVSSGKIGLNAIQLVAGNRDFSGDTNAYNPIFKSLRSKNILVSNQIGEIEDDLPEQRVGFIASEYNAGNLYIYYKDNNNAYQARQVYNTGIVGVAMPI